MEIQTKFNVGEIGLILDNGATREVRIKAINIGVRTAGPFLKEEVNIKYDVSGNNTLYEHGVFKTKEELFESIPIKEL